MNKHTRDLIKELQRRGLKPITIEYTGKGHIRLRWPSGSIIVSNSPSKTYAIDHARADIRRNLRRPRP
jgi:hypothetical protein